MNTPPGIAVTSFQETQHSPKKSSQSKEGESGEILQQGFNFRPIFSTLKRRAPLMIGIFSFFFGAAAIQYLKSPDTYQGSFRILIQPVASRERVIDPSALTRGEDIDGRGLDYSTQIEILSSPSILQDIVKQVQAYEPDVTLKTLRRGLTISRVGLGQGRGAETKILEIVYMGSSPEEVQTVLDIVTSRYLEYSLEERKTSFSQGVQFIEEQLPEVNQRVAYLRHQLENLKQENLISDLGRVGIQLTERVETLNTLQSDVSRQLSEARTLYRSLQQQVAMAPDDAIAAASLSEEPRYQELLNQLSAVDSEIATESARFTEQSATIQRLREEEARLTALIEEKAQSIIGQNVSSDLSNPQVYAYQNRTRLELIQQLIDTANQMKVLETSYQNITQEKNRIISQARQFPSIATRYTEIEQQLNIASRTLDQLLTQRETLRVEAAQNEIPWELVAEPSILPYAIPPSKKALILAGGVGALLAAGAALALDKYQGLFFVTEDIQDAIQLPILGVIPFCPTFDRNLDRNQESINFPQAIDHSRATYPLFQEAFTGLYASLRFLSSDGTLRSIVICSATPEDGKTTTCLNLAKAAHDTDQRVLLVDANLRHPSIHTRLAIPNKLGLSDLLTSTVHPHEVIQESVTFPSLHVVTAGSPNEDASRLLASPKMKQAMREWRSRYDLVIYDTPHLLGLADANFLAAQSDGIIMVVGIRHTKRPIMMQVLSSLDAYNLPLLGIVANHRREGHGSYGYYNRFYRKKLWQRSPSSKPYSQTHTSEDNVTITEKSTLESFDID